MIFNKILFIVCLFAKLASANAAPEKCSVFKDLQRRQGFLLEQDKMLYCLEGCINIRHVDCTIPKSFDIKFPSFIDKFINRARARANSFDDGESLVDLFTAPVSYEVFWKTVWFFIPYLTPLIPLVLHTWVGKGGFLTFLCTMYALTMIAFYKNNIPVIVHTIIYAFVAGTASVGVRTLGEVASYLCYPLILGVIALVVTDLYLQLAVGVIASAVSWACLTGSFRSNKEQDRLSLLIGIVHMVVVIDYLKFIIGSLAMYNPAIAWVNLVVAGSASYGKYFSLLVNAESAAIDLVVSLQGRDPEILTVLYFFAFVFYIFLTFVTRAIAGALVLQSFRFKPNLAMLPHGFYSYCVDIWGPITVLFSLPSNAPDMRNRKVYYSIVMVILTGLECYSASEIIMLRIAIWCYDCLFESGLQNAVRFLDCDFDCAAISFPKIGSFPFFSIDGLMELKKATGVVICKLVTDNGDVVDEKRGVAFLRSDKRGMHKLYTATHVMEGSNKVTFEGLTMDMPMKRPIGTGDDPIIGIDWADEGIATNIPFLTKNEIKEVAFLFLVSGKGPIAPITKFKFNQDCTIEATVNVMQGDSGSPVVAILFNGEQRLCGAVSRGSFDSGQGNIISSVVTDDDTGSPGTPREYIETVVSTAKHHKAMFASLHKELQENAEWYDAYMKDLDGWEKYKNLPEDDWPQEFKERHQKRIKSQKKTRAYRKRRILTDRLCDLISLSADEKIRVQDAVEHGEIIDFNAKRACDYDLPKMRKRF